MRLATLFTTLLLIGVGLVQAAEPVTLEKKPEEGFVCLFDGKTLEGWQGSTNGYSVIDGAIVVTGGGNLYLAKEYANFAFRFEFCVPIRGNNGIGIRTPMNVNAAYHGMEIQVLEENYQGIQPYQAHGSIYGVVPAKRGHQKPVGQWNSQEIRCDGSQITITLNGVVIVDADLDEIKETLDGHEHPGLHNESGHIGFLGHGPNVKFRNIRIKELP